LYFSGGDHIEEEDWDRDETLAQQVLMPMVKRFEQTYPNWATPTWKLASSKEVALRILGLKE